MESLGLLPTLAFFIVRYLPVITVLLIPVIVYYQRFDPLRTYPGPLVARFTNAYAGYYAIRKCLHLTTYHNFQKYGPVIRQAPNRLVFNTVTALHDIYPNPNVTKGEAYRNSQLRAKYPSLINVIDKDQHRRKRKYIGQALSERSMRNFEPAMESQVTIFLKELLKSAEAKAPADMTKRCQRLGLDVIGLLSFGWGLFRMRYRRGHYIAFTILVADTTERCTR
ncbi:cytochrome P450 [Astrocystis sublimbata]|nr:cytochrome P450 [Astrocystis sublimbata]